MFSNLSRKKVTREGWQWAVVFGGVHVTAMEKKEMHFLGGSNASKDFDRRCQKVGQGNHSC